MERENMFIIITILFLMIIAIYESMATNKGSIILGNKMGAWVRGSHETAELDIDGHTLPPLIEYKKELRLSIKHALNTILENYCKLHPKSKSSVTKAKAEFDRYYSKAFSRYIFECNNTHDLTKNLVPKKNPIIRDDIMYYLESLGLQNVVDSLMKSKMPYYPEFNKSGQRINAVINTDLMRVTNTVTGDSIDITMPQLKRIQEVYSGPEELFSNMAYTVLYIYHNLGALGNYGSVPIGLIDSTFIELFGSPLNTQQNYCSAFLFEKEYFKSLGSFFDYNLVKNQNYTCNPPYIDGLMTEAIRRVTTQMTRLGAGSNVTMLVVVPIWDSKGLREIGEISAANEKDANHPDDVYQTRELLDNTQWKREHRTLHKNDHKYYSWYNDSLINYSHTHLYILSTEDTPSFTLDSIISKWDSLVTEKEKQSFAVYMDKKEE